MADTIANLVNIVLANPAPVVLVDTCSSLDLLRACYRDNVQTQTVAAAIRLIAAATASPPTVWLINTDLTTIEFANHVLQVTNELLEHLNWIDDTTAALTSAGRFGRNPHRILNICDRLWAFISRRQHSNPFYPAVAALEPSLSSLSQDFQSAFATAVSDPACQARGLGRMATVTAPCRSRGSTNSADCIIIEHFLEFASQLGTAGFTFKRVFVSSNTKDYGKAPLPKGQLRTDFVAAGIDFVSDLYGATSTLGI